MNEPALDLRASWAAIRRRRVLVASMGLVGFLLAGTYGVLKPPLPSSVALVLLPPASATSNGIPTRNTATQIAIATSAPVLAKAGRSISPPISAGGLKSDVKVTAVSPDVLSIQVRAADSADATKLANSIARDYVQYVTTSATSGNSTAGLSAEATQLTQQVNDLQDQINAASAAISADGASSPAGQQETSLLGSLRNEQAQVALELQTVNSQIIQGRLNGDLSAGAIRMLQPATPVSMSKLHLVTLGALGLIGGLVVGSLAAAFGFKRDRRLRRRGEIAASIGVPVLASLSSAECTDADDWRVLLQSPRPPVADVWALRRVLHQLGVGDGRQGLDVTLVSFAEDHAALTVGPLLASFAASIGIPTVLEPSDHPELALLRTVYAASSRADGSSVLPHETDPRSVNGMLTVSVIAVDRDRPRVAQHCRGMSLLVVSSGFASGDDIAQMALAIVDSGHEIDGILVVNPDPDDTTSGVEAGIHYRQYSIHHRRHMQSVRVVRARALMTGHTP